MDAEAGVAETVSGANDFEQTSALLIRALLYVLLLRKRMWKQGPVLKMMRYPWMN